MKYLVTASADCETAPIDEFFGRAPWFMVFDDEIKTWSAHVNEAGNATQGAGIMAATNAVNLGVSVVISGAMGPKALQILEPAGVEIFSAKNMTVAEALVYYLSKK